MMKKKHENIIWNVYENMKQVPLAVSGFSAPSSTLLSYANTYKDMEFCWTHFITIMESIKNIESFNDIIKKYDKDEIDIGEIQGSIDWYTERMNDSVKKINDFIDQRKNENWR